MSEIIGRKSAVCPASDHEMLSEIWEATRNLVAGLDGRVSMVELMEHDAKVRRDLIVDVLEILTHATCERPEGKSWLLGLGEVEAAIKALEK